jgi:hypothetical protein
MGWEKTVLNVVKATTDTPAYFYNGTLFLETVDSKIAVEVFNAIRVLDPAISLAKVGDETAIDFLA